MVTTRDGVLAMTDYAYPTEEQFAKFNDLPSNEPLHMLNLIRVREHALYPDGRKCSGIEAYKAYGRESLPVFSRLGGFQFYIGKFEQTLIGPAEERWDIVFIAQYPNTTALTEMLRDPVYGEAVKHREAAVEDTRVIRLKPGVPGKGFGQYPSDTL